MDIFESPELVPESYQEGYHPLELFLKSDTSGRSDLVLNHPDILGFIYLQGNIVMKAFMCIKVVDWHEANTDDFKSIAAINGTSDNFTPFSVPECILFSDQVHLLKIDERLVENAHTCSITKYIKENKKKLNLPDTFHSCSTKLATFPTVLPLIKGYSIKEGDLRNEDFRNEVSKLHPIYECWIKLKNGFHCTGDFCFEDCPLPKETGNTVIFEPWVTPTVLYRAETVQAWVMLEKELERHTGSKKYKEESARKASSLPEEVDLESKTVVTMNSATESKVSQKNERLIAFLSIMFSMPNYDRTGKLTSMHPATLSDDAMEILASTASLAEQARNLKNGLDALSRETAREPQYLSRFAKIPFLSQTVLTYILQANFHTGSIDYCMESLKKSFSILCLLHPPEDDNDEYTKYIHSSRNSEVESILEHPSEKKSGLRKEVFLKGKQESIEDIVTLAANLRVFGRFWTSKDNNCFHQQPLVITMMEEVAEFVSSPEFHQFFSKHKKTSNYIVHTIIVYMFNIFSLFVGTAQNPQTVRKFKVEGTIEDLQDIEMASLMIQDLLNQLRLCTVTGSLHTLFAHPPTSFPTFCPKLVKQESHKRKKPEDDDSGKKEPAYKKDKKMGSIINTTGKKMYFPKDLEERYCAEFLDTNLTCTRGEHCKYIHAVYPHGFKGNDAKIIQEHVEKTPGLSFVKKSTTDNKVS